LFLLRQDFCCPFFRDKVVVRQYERDNNRILAGDNPVLDTTEAENGMELKSEADARKLHQMAKVHNCLEMWQGSQNLRATQRESHTQNKQMTGVEYSSDTEEIVNESWETFIMMVQR
jgi:hypothetical protein